MDEFLILIYLRGFATNLGKKTSTKLVYLTKTMVIASFTFKLAI